MTRFFVRPDQIIGEFALLDAEDSLHLDRVLRAKPGDQIGLLDGSGSLFFAVLTSISKSRAEARIIRRESLNTEPSVRIVVAQALPKTAEKLEWVLQHGVEVGVSAFWIFRGRRSEAGKLAEKPERWAKIIKTAAEQSKRAQLPEASMVASVAAIVERTNEFDLSIMCDEALSGHGQELRQKLCDPKPASVLVLVGPEGGWADEERETMLKSSITPISLGKRILRTETAALVAISQILFALDAG